MKTYFQEFKQMGILNFSYRAYYELAKKYGLLCRKFKPMCLENMNLEPIDEITGSFKENAFLFNYETKSKFGQYLSNYPEAKARLVSEADMICANKISVFGLEHFFWGETINWNLDPISKNPWPVGVHWSQIDINAHGFGDIKYNWELNRHQHFYTIGRAYWATGEEKYADTFVKHIDSWIEQNPHELSTNWHSNLELALRVIAWIFGWHFFKESKCFTNEKKERFIKTLYLMAEHIYSNLNLSKYCISNDHIIGDCAGLLLFTLVFPEFKECEAWKNECIHELWKQLDRQVYSDGTYFAYSTNYHRFVVQFYILVLRLLKLRAIAIPKAAADKIEKMLDFLNEIISPKGTVPLIGENDGGKVYKLDNLTFGDYRNLITTGYKLLGINKAVSFDMEVNEEGLWILGCFDTMQQKSFVKKSMKFEGSGYYVLKDTNLQLIFHCGTNESGYGHADMMSIDVAFDGKSIIADCGTYLYNGPKEWRDYFKGTSSHNTICIDNYDQMVNHRRFKWLMLTKAHVRDWQDSEVFSFVYGYHEGYKRLEKPVTHERAIFLKKGEYAILADFIKGPGKHDIKSIFNYDCNDYRISEDGSSVVLEGDGGSLLSMVSCSYTDFELKVLRGEKEPIAGWISGTYGKLEPCYQFQYNKVNASLPIVIGNIMYSQKEDNEYLVKSIIEDITIDGSIVDDCFAVKVSSKEYEDYFVHVFDELRNKEIIIGGIGRFSGRTVFARLSKSGEFVYQAVL